MPRIIAGRARGTTLAAPAGRDTRPTADRTKEALFSILTPRLPGARFLDLFAGSGQVGLEALSRGAAEAVFVEKDRRALAAIRTNLERTHLEAGARVLPLDAAAALRRLTTERLSGTVRPFDIIFLDPPYAEAMFLLEKMARLMEPVAPAPQGVEPAVPAPSGMDPAAPAPSGTGISQIGYIPPVQGPVEESSNPNPESQEDEAGDQAPAEAAQAGLLASGGILVLEHDARQNPPSNVIFLQLVRSCKYGTAMLSFYQNRRMDG